MSIQLDKLFRQLIAAFKWLGYYLSVFFFFYLCPIIQKKVLKRPLAHMGKIYNIFGHFAAASFGHTSEFLNPHDVDLDEGHIIISNHRSWFDQMLMLKHFPNPIHFLAKSDYFKIPFLGGSMKNLECIPVNNKSLDESSKTILKNALANKEDICFFVEGTRGSGRALLPFRPGAFITAAKSGMPILPIYILGTEQCLSKENSLFSVESGHICIVVGKPVYFQKEEIEKQIADFEQAYTQIHNRLYDKYETFLKNAKSIEDPFSPGVLGTI